MVWLRRITPVLPSLPWVWVGMCAPVWPLHMISSVQHSWGVHSSVVSCWLAVIVVRDHAVESLPYLSCHGTLKRACSRIVRVLDPCSQAQLALVNAQLVQLNKEAAEVASEVKDVWNQLSDCRDSAKEAKLQKRYGDLLAKDRQLDERRSHLERQLTGALCPCLSSAVWALGR